MENQITVKSEYNSLDKILDFAKSSSPYQCSKDYDIWDVRTDSKGQMEKCVVIKKSAMHGLKIDVSQEDTINMTYITPSKIMNAYFGKSQKIRRNIIEIIADFITEQLLASFQRKAFDEMTQVFNKIAV